MSEQIEQSRVYWQPLSEMLNPVETTGENQSVMVGFDPEFIDITDYILRITHRIWEQKSIGRCFDYYSEICPVHTLGNYSETVTEVVDNTLKTIAAFPDRSLIGENVIWRALEGHGYYSSHRITSVMSNKGSSEFGPATGKTGRVTTIADCICKGNQIVYEWLVRDNSFLVKQLGIALFDAAQLQSNTQPNAQFLKWLSDEYQRVNSQLQRAQSHVKVKSKVHDMAQTWLSSLFANKNFSMLSELYQLNAEVNWPGGRHAVGIPAIAGVLMQWLAQYSKVKVSLDHLAVTEVSERVVDVALRWSLTGNYLPDITECAGRASWPSYLLAATHFQLRGGKIYKEWTVFDEVAQISNFLRQLPEQSAQSRRRNATEDNANV